MTCGSSFTSYFQCGLWPVTTSSKPQTKISTLPMETKTTVTKQLRNIYLIGQAHTNTHLHAHFAITLPWLHKAHLAYTATEFECHGGQRYKRSLTILVGQVLFTELESCRAPKWHQIVTFPPGAEISWVCLCQKWFAINLLELIRA